MDGALDQFLFVLDRQLRQAGNVLTEADELAGIERKVFHDLLEAPAAATLHGLVREVGVRLHHAVRLRIHLVILVV